MRRCAPLLLLLLLIPAAPARAQWSRDPGAPLVACKPGQLLTLAMDGAVPDGTGGALIPIFTQTGLFGASDIRLQRVAATGTIAPGWPLSGLVVHAISSTVLAEQQVVPDGSGGGIVVWSDGSSGVLRPWAQRVSAAGVAQWAAGGVTIGGPSTSAEHDLAACTDGAGGAYVAFEYDFSVSDHDIYVSHVFANGTSTVVAAAYSTLNEHTPCIAPDGVGGFYLGYVVTNADLDVAFQHWNAQGGVTASPSLTLTGNQLSPVVVADGFGAAWFAWRDDRNGSGTAQQRGMRMLPSGPATGHSTNGVPFSAPNGPNTLTRIVADGRGGAFCTWSSAGGPRVCRVDSLGLAGPAWALGRIVDYYSSAADVHATTDGSGGVLLALSDTRLGAESPQLYAGRLTAAGALAPLSVESGRVVVQAPSFSTSIVPDGNGGAVVVTSSNGYGLVYAQHIDHYATLGDSRPTALDVRDVRGDQGGAVRLSWNASPMDGDPDWGISNYWIWRQTPATAAQAAIATGRGAWLGGAGAGLAAGRVFRPASVAGYAWELLAQQPANASAQYSYVAATTSDSMPGYNPVTVFMVEAHSALDANAFWPSAPDSGWSVDNLPPATPAPFTGTYTPALTSLQWGANHEADLAGYRLYRGATTAFVPGPGNLVASPTTTAWSASAPIGVYKLTAIDAQGNESPVATLVPVGVAGVDDAPAPRALAFALASASPAAGAVRLRFALPQAAPVRVAIYDAAGREVRVLADGAYEAGEWTRAWDGTDARGNLAASGLYFARLEAGAEQRTLRFVRTR